MQTAQAAGGNGCCFLYVFCFDRAGSRITNCSTGDCQLRPGGDSFQLVLLGTEECSQDGGLARRGVFGVVGGEDQSVAAGSAMLVTGPGRRDHHSPL